MATKYDHYAFISYNHNDKEDVIWLQNSIEKYSIPTKLLKQHNIIDPPQKIKTFRDDTDMPIGTNLSETIKEELRRSKYLIVCCSLNATNSFWVSKEIEYFKELKREQNIIPIIIEKKPAEISNIEEKTYPKGLSKERLGVKLYDNGDNKAGKQLALSKIIAGLFGLPPDVIIQRDKQRESKIKWAWGIGITTLIVTLSTFSIVLYDQNKNISSQLFFQKSLTSEKVDNTKALRYAEKSYEINQNTLALERISTLRNNYFLWDQFNSDISDTFKIIPHFITFRGDSFPPQDIGYFADSSLIMVFCSKTKKIELWKHDTCIDSNYFNTILKANPILSSKKPDDLFTIGFIKNDLQALSFNKDKKSI
ncbi:MAG: toll/interleukin-1 receptor domain-containing protein [Bacteroidetes bacterium]|nr:toll/interleukin-1 receptor domain-containing protein [Bacteroidota bacterium]